jgi:trehalose 6-phosphate synthase/phosphatase
LDQATWDRLVVELAVESLVPIPLTREECERFYDGFSNSFVWPILHSLTGKVPAATDDWEVYRAVNQRFADAIVARYQHGDLIWIHDFHLLLVPTMVREALPDAAIGFFLHVPFPTADVFRTIPQRTALLRGLLGANLIGFHTASYLRFFSAAVLELLGLPTEIDRVAVDDRSVKLGVFPIGIDAERFASIAQEPFVQDLIGEVRGDESVRLLVSVDRLDYTKGVRPRLLSFERLLMTHPELQERVRLVNLSVPTREAVPMYQEFRQEIEGLVGRINGRFSTPRWTPIHYLFRAVDRANLVALYRAADVMLVTPIRDGMNLVAKEFVASRVDGDGVLVLSEFAGAAADLPEAVIVNPYEIDDLAGRMADALTMPPDERRRRMAALRHRVSSYDNGWWAKSFLTALESDWRREQNQPIRLGSGGLELAVARVRNAPRRVIVLDYDGTVTPIVRQPELAVPDTELLNLLGRLADDRRNQVHIVSGRSSGFLERWLGHLKVHLHAEHGAASRKAGGKTWRKLPLSLDWLDRVRGVFEDFSRVAPGAFTETKEFGLCWHWRAADPGAERTAAELAMHLSQVLQRTGADVLVGNRVVEVRAHGVNKGRVGTEVLDKLRSDTAILAAGDDATDEDLFRVLPSDALTIRVGPGATAASYILPDVTALRALLACVLDSRKGPTAPRPTPAPLPRWSGRFRAPRPPGPEGEFPGP